MKAGLDTFLAALDRLIVRQIARLRARYELSLDEFRGLYVSDAQVDALLRADGEDLPAQEGGDDWKAAVADLVHRHPAIARLARIEPNVHALALLLVALAPAIDPRYETFFAYLNDDATRKQPTLDLVLRLLAVDADDALAVRAVLLPGAPLVVTGLLRVCPAQDGAAGPILIAAHAGLVPLLFGIGFQDERAEPMLDRHPPRDGAELPPALLDDVAARIARGVAAAPRAVALTPSATLGAVSCTRDLCVRRDCGLVVLYLARVSREISRETVLRAVTVAALEDALLLICGWSEGERSGNADLSALPAALRATRATVLIETSGVEVPADAGPLIRVAMPTLDAGVRTMLWQDALAALDVAAAVADVADLALRFRLGTEAIAASARLLADDGGVPSRAQLFAAARCISDDPLARLAQRVPQRHGLDRLVLPPATAQRVAGLIDALATRHRVLDEWGLGRTVGASGLRAMFAGPPGTGKTMTTGIIARELGLDAYRIDLSQVVSKYIGETEKNMERIFTGAAASNAILFFDEADALFGKRSEIKDAHDRFANIETAYLLQRIEDFDGIIFLATNISRNIDSAFARRMQFVIEFPPPGVAERAALWRGIFPASAPLAADIDHDFLADRFELAGGDIRNVALDAAFLAAGKDEPIGMPHIIQAIARELAKQGRSPSATDFRQHFDLLERAG